jgi:hypothetical protein
MSVFEQNKKIPPMHIAITELSDVVDIDSGTTNKIKHLVWLLLGRFDVVADAGWLCRRSRVFPLCMTLSKLNINLRESPDAGPIYGVG